MKPISYSFREAAQTLGLSVRQVFNLVALAKARGGEVASFYRKTAGRERKKRLGPEVEKIIASWTDGYFLQKQRITVSRLVLDIRGACLKSGLPPPSGKAVRARLARIPGRIVAMRRNGRAEARQRRPVTGEFPAVAAPWEVVQIDQTPMDVLLVDPVHRRPIGRPTLSVAIDVYSRCILGFAVTLENASAITVALSLTHAVAEKSAWLALRGLDLHWPVWGLPKVLAFDRGAEYGKAFHRGLQQWGVTPRERPPGAPWLHGCVERLMRTLMAQVHVFPGTTFSNVDERGTYRSEAWACLTLDSIERLTAMMICNLYNRAVHSEIKDRPIDQYTGYYAGSDSRPPSLPARLCDERRFFIDFLPYEERRLTRTGFELYLVQYYDEGALLTMFDRESGIGARPRKHVVRFDPRDLSIVYVLDDARGEYLEIGYRKRANPPITLKESEAARAKLATLRKDTATEKLLFDTVQQMRAEISLQAEQTKSARRSAARRDHALAGARRERIMPSGTASMPATVMPPDGGEASALPVPAPVTERFDDIDEVI